MKSIWVLLGIAVSGLGCVTSFVETTRLNAAPRPLVPRPARSVEIYASSPPTRPHVDVALLRASQPNYGIDTPRMVQSLAERAGQLGCDALFISGASERSGARGDMHLLDPGSQHLLATCIAYHPQSPSEALAASGPPTLVANSIVLVPPEERKPRPDPVTGNIPVGATKPYR